ncbi:serine protease [Pseudonocardiaceae bacterium YIM PH 21723]|nr:serine protease [Pseudonocardiaceae bacterium YIM PH 21723]
MRLRSIIACAVATIGALVISGVPAAGIVGGTQATENYAGIVSIGRTQGDVREHWCGGTLIAPRYVVTTAHCLWEPLSGYYVHVGSNNRTAGERINVAAFWSNAKFDRDKEHFDIALLKLEHPASGPIMPLTNRRPLPGEWIRLLGWGQTCPQWTCKDGSAPGANQTAPYDLKQVDRPVTGPETCYSANVWTEQELCVDVNQQASSCYGDSGGPAIQWLDGRWVLVGLDGRGGAKECGINGVTYTDVAAFGRWITDTMAKADAVNP